MLRIEPVVLPHIAANPAEGLAMAIATAAAKKWLTFRDLCKEGESCPERVEKTSRDQDAPRSARGQTSGRCARDDFVVEGTLALPLIEVVAGR